MLLLRIMFLVVLTSHLPTSISQSERFYVYDFPSTLNQPCVEQVSRYNWISDMGFEIWPPKRSEFHMNWMFAIEVRLIPSVCLFTPINLCLQFKDFRTIQLPIKSLKLIFTLQPAVHAILMNSTLRTKDPDQAHWFYIPFYAGCRFRRLCLS